jgi:hypothetical protein
LKFALLLTSRNVPSVSIAELSSLGIFTH